MWSVLRSFSGGVGLSRLTVQLFGGSPSNSVSLATTPRMNSPSWLAYLIICE